MKSLSIILVQPESPANIGAVARAMKNMGFADLRLVSPPADWEDRATVMAVSAVDILHGTQVFSNLKEAVSDRQWVIGTSRRQGAKRQASSLSWPEFLKKIRRCKGGSASRPCTKIGLVFGKESKGLFNRDLALCDHVITIPAHPEYPSLNLAQAVMVVLFSVSFPPRVIPTPAGPPSFVAEKSRRDDRAIVKDWRVSKQVIEDILESLEEVLKRLGYEREGPDVLGRILSTWRGLFSRAGFLEKEAQMMKGFTRRIRERTLNLKS